MKPPRRTLGWLIAYQLPITSVLLLAAAFMYCGWTSAAAQEPAGAQPNAPQATVPESPSSPLLGGGSEGALPADLLAAGPEPVDGISALALVVLSASFIDCVVSLLIEILALSSLWRRILPDPSTIPDDGEVVDGPSAVERRAMAATRLKLVYYLLAAILGVGVIAGFGQVRLFFGLGFTQMAPWLDRLLTGLLLAAGAERIGEWTGMAVDQEPKPIEITGSVNLRE